MHHSQYKSTKPIDQQSILEGCGKLAKEASELAGDIAQRAAVLKSLRKQHEDLTTKVCSLNLAAYEERSVYELADGEMTTETPTYDDGEAMNQTRFA